MKTNFASTTILNASFSTAPFNGWHPAGCDPENQFLPCVSLCGESSFVRNDIASFAIASFAIGNGDFQAFLVVPVGTATHYHDGSTSRDCSLVTLSAIAEIRSLPIVAQDDAIRALVDEILPRPVGGFDSADAEDDFHALADSIFFRVLNAMANL